MLIVPEYEPAANVPLPSELKVKADIRPDEIMLSSALISISQEASSFTFLTVLALAGRRSLETDQRCAGTTELEYLNSRVRAAIQSIP